MAGRAYVVRVGARSISPDFDELTVQSVPEFLIILAVCFSRSLQGIQFSTIEARFTIDGVACIREECIRRETFRGFLENTIANGGPREMFYRRWFSILNL